MTHGGMKNAQRRTRIALAMLMAMAMLAAACSSEPQTPATDTTTAPDPTTTTTTSQPDPATVETTTEAPEPEPVWPEPDPDPTPIPLRDDARFGTLANGMDYLALSNDSPGSSVSMRLVVRAGGVHEDPVGTGVAHFLEHMMFNGTEKYPGNTLDAALRRIGAEIGPDFNAWTSDNATVYQIDVEDRADNVATALDVLAQWASAATIEPDAVVDESGVVREELRVRDESGDGRIGVLFEEAYYAGTPYEGVNVTGTADSVLTITADDLRTYYDTWYHPEHLAVVIVGDRPVEELEAAVVDVFAEIEGRAAPGSQPTTGPVAFPSEPLVSTIIEPGSANSYVSVDIPTRAWDQSTLGGQRARWLEILASLILDQRLGEGVDAGRLDLRRARASWFFVNRDLPYYGFNLDADDLEAGTEVFMTEVRASVENPFTADELEFFVDAIIEQSSQQLSQAETVQDRQLADQAVFHLLDGAPFQTIEDEVAVTEEILRSISVEDVNLHHGWTMANSQPLIIAVGPDESIVGTVAGHTAAVERAAAAEIGDAPDAVEEIDVLVEAPTPVEAERRLALARNDGFELVFGNDMRVMFRPSDIAAGQVYLYSESPGGRVQLEASDGALASLSTRIVANSGLGPWDPVQMRRYLADVDAVVSPYIADTTEGFSGRASIEDVETMFELLHLGITQPRVDDVPFAQQVEFARDTTAAVPLDASFAADVEVADRRTGGGSLAAVPTDRQIDSLSPADAERIHVDRFSRLDDHVIVIVGDIDPDQVIDLAETWIGTLPVAVSEDPVVELPADDAVSTTVTAGSGSSTGAWRWTAVADGTETVPERVLAAVVSTVLDDRLFTVIREELGATYGGRASIVFEEPGDTMTLSIAIDGDPDRLDEIAERVAAELASLASNGPTSEDFGEAVSIIRTEYNFIDNGFFIESLIDEAVRPDDQVIERGAQVRALDNLSAGDVAAFIRRFTDATSTTYEVFARP